MKVRNVAVSFQGMARHNNEDSYFADSNLGLFIVSDGMGGHKAGEVASAMAVKLIAEKICELFKEYIKMAETTLGMPRLNPEEIISQAIDYANTEIYQSAKEDSERRNMGATVTLAWVYDDIIYFGHVGDSRAYFFGEEVRLVTKDHSVVQMMVDRGDLTPELAKSYPGKNLITRAIGTDAVVMCDIFHWEVVRGDYLLLCSDGLSNVMDDQEILFEVAHGVNKQHCCQRLLSIAKNRGAPDNVTSVLVMI